MRWSKYILLSVIATAVLHLCFVRMYDTEMRLTAADLSRRLSEMGVSTNVEQLGQQVISLHSDPALNHLRQVRLRITSAESVVQIKSQPSWPFRWHNQISDIDFLASGAYGTFSAEIPQSAIGIYAVLALLWIMIASTTTIVFLSLYQSWNTNRALREALRLAGHALPSVIETNLATANLRQAADFTLRQLATEVDKHQAAARRHGRNLRTLADRIPVGILIYAASGRIKSVNRYGMALLGAASLRDRPSCFSEILPMDERNSFSRLLRQLNTTGTHSLINIEQRRSILDKHGNRLSIRCKELIFGTSAAGSIVAVFFQDLTSSDQTEAALQQAIQDARHASDMKSRFLAMISHEIRTPLNGITGLADLLMRESPAQHQVEYLSLLAGSTHHLKGLLTDILDFSKIEAGQMSLDCMPLDLRQLVHSVCQSYEAAASAKNLTLQLTSAGLTDWVRADAVRLRQIVSNLIDNAIKFSQKGCIEIVLTATPSASSAARLLVRIEVTDNGIGIDPEVAKRLFTPFTQANLSITRTFGGTGLGLSLCRLLSRMMGGDISVQSTPGVGSTFSVLVQLDKCPAIGKFSTEESFGMNNPVTSSHSGTDLGGLQFLVADDNTLNQRILKRWFELRGAIVDLAGNGEEAVAAAMSKAYDVILMDISMPVLNGIDATREIRMSELQLGRRPVPIIGVTALSTADDYSAAMFSGMTACIGKPVDRTELMTQVDKTLTSSPPAQSSFREFL